MNYNVVLLLTLAAFSAATGQVLFKLGASGAQTLVDFFNPKIFTGLLFYGVGTAIWIYALSSELLVNVYAFTALTFVLVYLAGIFFLGEYINTAGLLGVAFVLGGLYLITAHGSLVVKT